MDHFRNCTSFLSASCAILETFRLNSFDGEGSVDVAKIQWIQVLAPPPCEADRNLCDLGGN